MARGKVLVFSGCNSHPATGSLQPVAIGAAVEETKPSEPSRQMCRFGDAASRQAVTRVNIERPRNDQCGRRPCTRMGKAAAAGDEWETGGIGRPTSDQNPAGHRGNDDGMSVQGDQRNTGNPIGEGRSPSTRRPRGTGWTASGNGEAHSTVEPG